MNDDGREVKRQKLADDDSAISIGDLTRSEITEVATRFHFFVRSIVELMFFYTACNGCININHLTLAGWNS